MALMMCAGLHRLKSLSLTNLTAEKAVLTLVAFEKTKGSRLGAVEAVRALQKCDY